MSTIHVSSTTIYKSLLVDSKEYILNDARRKELLDISWIRYSKIELNLDWIPILYVARSPIQKFYEIKGGYYWLFIIARSEYPLLSQFVHGQIIWFFIPLQTLTYLIMQVSESLCVRIFHNSIISWSWYSRLPAFWK